MKISTLSNLFSLEQFPVLYGLTLIACCIANQLKYVSENKEKIETGQNSSSH